MTSIASLNSAALLILQEVNASSVARKDDTTSATDKITALVNGVSGEESSLKLRANSKITSGLLDAQQADDGIVSHALRFLESDSFKSSDPSVTETLKGLISGDGGKFAILVSAERAKSPGISDDNAMANAIQSLIRSNRDKFAAGEFVIGFALSNGGAIMANIEDINGNSTSKTLMDGLKLAHNAYTEAAGVIISSDGSNAEAHRAASAVLTGGYLADALNDVNQWNDRWRKAFGF